MVTIWSTLFGGWIRGEFNIFTTIEVEKVNKEESKINNDEIKQTTYIVQPLRVVVTMDTSMGGIKRAHEFESFDSDKEQVSFVNNESLAIDL